ncbi:probable serine/threonine-protein kinase kinX, partial [Solenopsis invicta]|uniref:probable serine/threonine-protein kinase kinX n=1 Tax=Solenopsis invicta TaxID=13686 RepID=UPI00193E5313
DSPQTSEYLDAKDGSQSYSERYESLDEESSQDDQLEEDEYDPDEYLPEDQDDEYDPDEDDEQHILEEEEDYSDQEIDEQDSVYERFDTAEYEQHYEPIEAEQYPEEDYEIVDTTTSQTLDDSEIIREHEPIEEYSQEDQQYPDESENSSQEEHFTEYDPRGGLFLDEIPQWQEEEDDYIVEEPQDGDQEDRITTIQPQNRSIATQSQQLTQLMANLPNQHEETYQDDRVQARIKATRYSTRGGTTHATLESEYHLCTITVKEETTEQFNLPECTITPIRRKIVINGTYINKNNKIPREEVETLKPETKVKKHTTNNEMTMKNFKKQKMVTIPTNTIKSLHQNEEVQILRLINVTDPTIKSENENILKTNILTTEDEDYHMETARRTIEPIPTEEESANLKQKEKIRLVDENKQKHETVSNKTHTLKKSEVDTLNEINIAKSKQNHAKTALHVNQVRVNAPQNEYLTKNEPSSTTVQEQVQSISNNIQNLQDQLQNLINKAKTQIGPRKNKPSTLNQLKTESLTQISNDSSKESIIFAKNANQHAKSHDHTISCDNSHKKTLGQNKPSLRTRSPIITRRRKSDQLSQQTDTIRTNKKWLADK